MSPSRLRREAQKARRRLYPSSLLYPAFSLTVLAAALRSHPWPPVLAWFGSGVVGWTLLEYFVHRYVLHGRFPHGPALHQRFAHKFFDPLHWEHHARPWDGDHINGTLKDTGPFAVAIVALGFLVSRPAGPLFVAGLLLAYVAEEWIHQSVHFYNFDNRYFRYIRRHHLYHHSPKGANAGYGLTSGFWDAVWNSRFPAEERRALYRRKRKAKPGRTPCPPRDAASRHDGAGVLVS